MYDFLDNYSVSSRGAFAFLLTKGDFIKMIDTFGLRQALRLAKRYLPGFTYDYELSISDKWSYLEKFVEDFENRIRLVKDLGQRKFISVSLNVDKKDLVPSLSVFVDKELIVRKFNDGAFSNNVPSALNLINVWFESMIIELANREFDEM